MRASAELFGDEMTSTSSKTITSRDDAFGAQAIKIITRWLADLSVSSGGIEKRIKDSPLLSSWRT